MLPSPRVPPYVTGAARFDLGKEKRCVPLGCWRCQAAGCCRNYNGKLANLRLRVVTGDAGATSRHPIPRARFIHATRANRHRARSRVLCAFGAVPTFLFSWPIDGQSFDSHIFCRERCVIPALDELALVFRWKQRKLSPRSRNERTKVRMQMNVGHFVG